MFRTLCLTASLFAAAASVASAQDSLSAGQYVRVHQRKAPVVEGILLSLSSRHLVIATSPTDTARIVRKQVRRADVYQAPAAQVRAEAPGGSEVTEQGGVWVKVKRVRSGPAPSLGMHIMF